MAPTVEPEPEQLRRRTVPTKTDESSTATYTIEHAEAVKRIKKCKDYYEILMVKKDATDSEIKKAYKRLALLLHPDKNTYPGAAEAFKAIGEYLIAFFYQGITWTTCKLFVMFICCVLCLKWNTYFISTKLIVFVQFQSETTFLTHF